MLERQAVGCQLNGPMPPRSQKTRRSSATGPAKIWLGLLIAVVAIGGVPRLTHRKASPMAPETKRQPNADQRNLTLADEKKDCESELGQ
jgi:hypothetical protein